LWAWSAVGGLPPAAPWAYPIGVLLALALHLANALPDDAAVLTRLREEHAAKQRAMMQGRHRMERAQVDLDPDGDR
jgi:hypothetical protein